MDIVHLASECAPFAKVGGLGDMVYGLARATKAAGHNVIVFLPKYDIIDTHLLKDLKVEVENFDTHNTLWSAKTDDISLLLLEAHPPKLYFNRGHIYGEEDDTSRFLYFCKVAMKFLSKKPPDVLHLHDWPVAICALLAKEMEKTKTIYTIHNMEYQGKCLPENFEEIGLDPEKYRDDFEDPEDSEKLNLVKGALKYSDIITAVSPSYAEEIQTPDFGFNLDQILLENKEKLMGILNSIDTNYWNPEKDPHLIKNYNFESHLEGKKTNKRHLQNQFNLEERDKPLVISITRLVSQKGPDLIYYGIEKTLEMGGQYILLGSCSNSEMQALFHNLSHAYEGNPNLAIMLDFDEALSHLLFSAADMFLMPSIFEPCGLTQMISMHYGTIPLVHSTGGLKDTVFDLEKSETPNGFVFHVPDNRGVADVLERAFAVYHEDKETWHRLIKNAMERDVSWDLSAKKYLEIYEK